MQILALQKEQSEGQGVQLSLKTAVVLTALLIFTLTCLVSVSPEGHLLRQLYSFVKLSYR